MVHDHKVNQTLVEEKRQQAHENACRELLEICLKEGLIEFEDSDLDIVRELKEVINNDKISQQTKESKNEEKAYSSSSS